MTRLFSIKSTGLLSVAAAVLCCSGTVANAQCMSGGGYSYAPSYGYAPSYEYAPSCSYTPNYNIAAYPTYGNAGSYQGTSSTIVPFRGSSYDRGGGLLQRTTNLWQWSSGGLREWSREGRTDSELNALDVQNLSESRRRSQMPDR